MLNESKLKLMLGTVTWDVSPDFICISDFCIKWYGLMWGFAVLGGYVWAVYTFKRENKEETLAVTLVQYIFIGGLLGARLGEFLFYRPEVLIENPLALLNFRAGGMASHGGFLGVLLAAYLFCRSYPGFRYGWLLDKLAVAGIWIVMLMRIGNLINSELIGVPTHSDFGFLFVLAESNPVPRHPVVLYEAIAYGFLLLLFLRAYGNEVGKKEWKLTGLFLTFIPLIRILMEFYKEAPSGDFFMGISKTQWLSVPLIIAGIFILLFVVKRKESYEL